MLRLAVLLVVSIASTFGLIRCPADYCSQVQCAAELTADSCAVSGGRFQEKGGFCGCCPSCVEQIGEGQSCVSTLLLGVPSTAECAQGLYCDSTKKTCTKKTCAMTLEELSALTPVLGRSLPVCADDGSYAPKQCSGSRCSCVTKDGTTIDGTSVPIWESQNVHCTCAQDKQEYKKLGIIGKMFRCTSNGNYDSIQCMGSACYCAHPESGKRIESSQAVPIGQITSLNC